MRRFFDHRIIAHKFKMLAPTLPRPDAIVTAMPAYDLAYQAVTYAKKHSIPVIVDIRVQWPDIFLDHVPGPANVLTRLLLSREFSMLKSLMRKADGLVSLTTPLLRWGLEYAEKCKTWKTDYDKYYKQHRIAPQISRLLTSLEAHDIWVAMGGNGAESPAASQ